MTETRKAISEYINGMLMKKHDSNDMLMKKLVSVLNESPLDKKLKTEEIAHDNFVKRTCEYIADKILKEMSSKISSEGKKLLNSGNDLSTIYDKQLESNMYFFGKTGYGLTCKITLDGADKFIILRFYDNNKAWGLEFIPNETDESIFTIGCSCKIIDNHIPLSQIQLLFKNKSYLVHELAHIILDRKSNTKTRKYAKNTNLAYYYNNPAEFNSYEKQLLVELDKFIKDNKNEVNKLLSKRAFNDVYDILKPHLSDSLKYFLYFLNSPNKKKIFQTIFDHIEYTLGKTPSFVSGVPFRTFDSTYSETYEGNKAKVTDHDASLYLNDIKQILCENN